MVEHRYSALKIVKSASQYTEVGDACPSGPATTANPLCAHHHPPTTLGGGR